MGTGRGRVAESGRERAVSRGDEHFSQQPFGQLPFLTDSDIARVESGAILLHLGERSGAPMSADSRECKAVIECLFAAASQPLSLLKLFGDTTESPGRTLLDDVLQIRLKHMEAILAGRIWLAGALSDAGILMADVLQLADRFGGLANHPACDDFLARVTARPAFIKAHADRMARFTAAD